MISMPKINPGLGSEAGRAMNKISRQRKWQLKKKADGRCAQCGKDRNLYKNLCDDCQKKQNELTRKRVRPVNEKISKQRRWQLKKKADGRCTQCGRDRNLYKSYCDDCQKKQTKLNRKRKGCKPWKPGNRGRPPLTAYSNP